MKEIKLQFRSGDYLIIEGDDELFKDICNDKVIVHADQNYQFVALVSDIPEPVFSKIVDPGSYIGTFWNYIKNDTHKSNQLRSGKNSFYSKLKAINWNHLPSKTFLFKAEP